MGKSQEIGIVVLAAGNSVRFHGAKLVEEVGGQKLYQYMIQTLEGISCPVVFVTQFEEIEKEAEMKGWYTVANPFPERGISGSIRLGLNKLLKEKENITGILFCVCDQPYLKRDTLERMMDTFMEAGGGIVCAEVNEHPGNPNLFAKEFFPELLKLEGDIGGREIIRRHPEAVTLLPVSKKKELMDIDVREDIEKAMCRAGE